TVEYPNVQQRSTRRYSSVFSSGGCATSCCRRHKGAMTVRIVGAVLTGKINAGENARATPVRLKLRVIHVDAGIQNGNANSSPIDQPTACSSRCGLSGHCSGRVRGVSEADHQFVGRYVIDLRKRGQLSDHSERQAQRETTQSFHVFAEADAVSLHETVEPTARRSIQCDDDCYGFVRLPVALQQWRNFVRLRFRMIVQALCLRNPNQNQKDETNSQQACNLRY